MVVKNNWQRRWGIWLKKSTLKNERIDWVPRKPTHVVLLDNTDSANGYATYFQERYHRHLRDCTRGYQYIIILRRLE